MLNGNILITGGAGYLGRGILARAAKERWPARFTIYSRDEQKQYECRLRHPRCSYVLGDIRDSERLDAVMANVDTVIHAAALKYIPEAELNVNEAISINVGGTQSVIAAVHRSLRVINMVLISTDKAVEPLNTYGLTKALAEKLMYEASREARNFSSVFNTVRYGNVIGSTGSVVPVFKRLARERGEITLTDPAMTRFWISIDQAIEIVLFALDRRSGSISIPSPYAMSLGELAEAVCPNVTQKVVGLRPGEKMHEKLLGKIESPRAEWIAAKNMYVFHPDVPPSPITAYELNSEDANKLTINEFREFSTLSESV